MKYPSPLTPQQKTDWLDTSPDTPRTNEARENGRDLLLECCALERELAEAKARITELELKVDGLYDDIKYPGDDA